MWVRLMILGATATLAIAPALASVAAATAGAYEPQPPPGLEEALEHPPGMPPPPPGEAPPAAAPAGEIPLTPAIAPEPLEQLAGHGRYWGLSIVGANGGHPIRRPRELWLAFGTITDYGGEGFEEKIDEYAALFWESNCNEHSYKVEATSTRLNLGPGGSTLVLCAGRMRKEERWLERFFRAGPHWRLTDGHLVLAARGSRIVMRHRRPRPDHG